MKCQACGKPLTKSYQKKFCSNQCKLSPDFYKNRKVTKKPNKATQRVICKLDGWSSQDVRNSSGALLKHLRTLGIDRYDPKYFRIEDIEPRPTKQCPQCDWSTKDITNISGIWTKHILNVHKQTVERFVEDNPEMESMMYHQGNLANQVKQSSTKDKGVTCAICGDRMFKITNTHLKTHQITAEQYTNQFPLSPIISKFQSQTFSRLATERNKLAKTSNRSNKEKQLAEWLEQQGLEVIVNRRVNGVEFDIMLPQPQIAIEFDGLLWHSETFGGKGRTYHLQKTKVAASIGYQLIHVFEDEWDCNQDLIKLRLLHKTGNTSSRVFARKCQLVELEAAKAREFLLQNHTQGPCKSSKYLGLLHEDCLVAVASFSKLRRSLGHTNSHHSYELVRFSTTKRVVGGLGKLTKSYFKLNQQCNRIVSYADLRYTDPGNNAYLSAGYKSLSTSSPNYWYMKSYKRRLHRFNFTKQRIVSKLGGDPTLSEWENMKLLGYDRIWDCGTAVYFLDR